LRQYRGEDPCQQKADVLVQQIHEHLEQTASIDRVDRKALAECVSNIGVINAILNEAAGELITRA
jgi:hypothetical protein